MDDVEQRLLALEKAVKEIQEHMGYGMSHKDSHDERHDRTHEDKSVPGSVIAHLHEKIERLERLIEQMQMHRA